MFLLMSRCVEVFATCPGDNTDPTQAKMNAGEVVKTQQVAKTTETTHTHTTLLVTNHTRNGWNFAELQHETVRLTLWLL